MIKIPYEILAVEVDKLYPPIYKLKPNETIEEHLLDVDAFIFACGWTPEEYVEEYIHRGVVDLLDVHFPDPKKQN